MIEADPETWSLAALCEQAFLMRAELPEIQSTCSWRVADELALHRSLCSVLQFISRGPVRNRFITRIFSSSCLVGKKMGGVQLCKGLVVNSCAVICDSQCRHLSEQSY